MSGLPDPIFSVVIPALNEAGNIRRCISGIRAQQPDVEIIVVDGGSTDGTAALAGAEQAVVCVSPPGRGTQCNIGAAHATGDVVLFLHADTALPKNGFELLKRYFRDSRVQLGMFRLGFDNPHWILKVFTQFTRFDSLFTKFGDQCRKTCKKI